MESIEERQALVFLSAVEGVGPARLHSVRNWAKQTGVGLCELVQNPENCPTLKAKDGLCDAVRTLRRKYSVAEYFSWVEDQAVVVVTANDEHYPTLLKHSAKHPLVLFCKGNISLLEELRPIAVVGTRRATPYGKRATVSLVNGLVKHGCSIISGFMYGIDTVAHQSAVNNRGHTIGVLGYGFGTPIFPSSHAQLFDYLLSEKALFITQFAPKVPALPAHFPMRNAVVAGMTLATIVVEAAEKSGTMITVSAALEEGRLVCAVPGPFDSEFSQGTKHLLNQGALLVTSAEDILVELGYLKTIRDANSSKKMLSKTSKLTSIQNVIVEALRSGTCQSDSLAEITKLPIVELTYELTDLEIQGIIEKSIEGWSLK